LVWFNKQQKTFKPKLELEFFSKPIPRTKFPIPLMCGARTKTQNNYNLCLEPKVIIKVKNLLTIIRIAIVTPFGHVIPSK